MPKIFDTEFKLTNGKKSINPWDTEDSPDAWVGLNNDPENLKFVALVPAVQSAWQARCKAMSDLPFCIYGKGDQEVDNSDTYVNAVGLLPNPRNFLWLTEAALVGYGRAYWFKKPNKYLITKGMQYFVPSSIEPKLETQEGLVGFDRRNGATTITYKPEQIYYVWLPDPSVEIGPPMIWPLESALLSAGALGQINLFIANYMERGAVKAMLLSAKGMPDKNEVERLEKWWNRFMSGARSLMWKVFNADALTPIIVGEGLEAFKGIQITDDLKHQVHEAMGTMHLLTDETYANKDVRARDFITNTIMPDARVISDALNEQVLKPMGYTIQFEPERMEIFQQDEADNAAALGTLTSAISNSSPDVIELSMSILGYELSEDQQALLDKWKAEKVANKEKVEKQTQTPTNESTTDPNEPDYSEDMAKWMRKACKHIGKDVDFVSNIIPLALQAKIHAGLARVKNVEEVRALFVDEKEIITPAPVYEAPDFTPLLKGIQDECRMINQMAQFKSQQPVVINNSFPAGFVQITNDIQPAEVLQAPPAQVVVNVPEQKAAVVNVEVMPPANEEQKEFVKQVRKLAHGK